MQTIKRRFFALRNGVVADTMRRAGAPYRVVFGLTLPQVAEIASQHGKDADMARRLWRDRSTRESLLLAPMLMPAEALSPEEAMDWVSTAVSTEVLDVLCLKLLNAFYSATFITRKTFFYGVITALPFLSMESEYAPIEVLLRPAVWGNIVFLSAFASVFAFMIWSIAIKKMGTVKASNYLYFQPVVTLIASAWVLSEKVTIVGYTGCALILVGVWLSDWLGRRSAMKRAS